MDSEAVAAQLQELIELLHAHRRDHRRDYDLLTAGLSELRRHILIPKVISRPTPRQKQVADLLLHGYTNTEIAEKLGVHLGTVKQAVSRMCQRYKVNNRISLALALYRERDERWEPQKTVLALKKRDRQIIEHVWAGENSIGIAYMIGLSPHVVKNYLRRIYDQTGMSTRLELALWWEANRSAYDSLTVK